MRLLGLFLLIKVSLLLVGMLGSRLLPFNWDLYRTNLVVDLDGAPEWMRPFNTWDTQHYILLAQRGYGANPMSNAFYPLYPYFIWLTTPIFGGLPLAAAWAVANMISFLVPVYVYKLARLFYPEHLAFRAALFQLAFPTAFYLSVGYSEAIYLALCLMAFYYVFIHDLPKACLFAFLLPLARAQGLLFVLPVGMLFLAHVCHQRAEPQEAVWGAIRAYAPPAAAACLGMAAYFALCHLTLGHWYEGLRAQQLYVSNNSLANLAHPVRWFEANFVHIDLRVHSYATSLLDRSAFVLCLPLLVGIYRTQHAALFVYAVATLLVPALAGTFMSYLRVLSVVFPIAIFLGTRTGPVDYLVVPMWALQILFYLMHTGAYWVA